MATNGAERIRTLSLADPEKRGGIKIGRRNIVLKDRAILQRDIRY